MLNGLIFQLGSNLVKLTASLNDTFIYLLKEINKNNYLSKIDIFKYVGLI